MERTNSCRWYNDTSGVKRAYDLDLIDKKWVEDYCWAGGAGCVRKKRFEEEGCISPDYVLPDGTISEKVKQHIELKGTLWGTVNGSDLSKGKYGLQTNSSSPSHTNPASSLAESPLSHTMRPIVSSALNAFRYQTGLPQSREGRLVGHSK